MKVLHPHQRQALAYAKLRRRIALFMEMRLGKSAVAIRWAEFLRLQRVLLIAPLSGLPGLGWENELVDEGVVARRITPLYRMPSAKRWAAAEANDYRGWNLINFEWVRGHEELLYAPWDGVIIDESTYIRNPKAQTTKAILRGLRHVPHRAILSGMPRPEHSLDYFCQMKFVQGEFLGFNDYWSFRHSLFKQVGYDWIEKKGVRDRIKKEVHRSAFVMTRKRAGVGSAKVYEARYVEMTPAQKRLQNEILKHFTFDGRETKWAGEQWAWLRQLAGGFGPKPDNVQLSDRKLKEMKALLDTELREQQVVVWASHLHELDAIERSLQAWKQTSVRVDGSVERTLRGKRQLMFQSGKARVFLCQERCGKFALNLSAADAAVYYSNEADYEARSQSEDRIIHLTKSHPMLYVDLITRGTVDEDMVVSLRDKRIDARRFMAAVYEHMRVRLAA